MEHLENTNMLKENTLKQDILDKEYHIKHNINEINVLREEVSILNVKINNLKYELECSLKDINQKKNKIKKLTEDNQIYERTKENLKRREELLPKKYLKRNYSQLLEDFNGDLFNFLEYVRPENELLEQLRDKIKNISKDYNEKGIVCRVDYEKALSEYKNEIQNTKQILKEKQKEFQPKCVHRNKSDTYFIDNINWSGLCKECDALIVTCKYCEILHPDVKEDCYSCNPCP
jgi:hypothetical protein